MKGIIKKYYQEIKATQTICRCYHFWYIGNKHIVYEDLNHMAQFLLQTILLQVH